MGLNSGNTNVYLGDGLYARYDGYQIELYASNGREETDHVFLEPGVLQAFFEYVERLKNGLKGES